MTLLLGAEPRKALILESSLVHAVSAKRIYPMIYYKILILIPKYSHGIICVELNFLFKGIIIGIYF